MLLETKIPFSYVLNKVHRDVVYVVIMTACVEIVVYYEREFLPDIPPTLPAFLGTAITLLLSFKVNQSYDRWWEARKIWGAIVNDSRTLVRQVLTFAADDPERGARISRRQVAWCYALGQTLRGLDWKTGAVDHLSADDVAESERHHNKPLALVQLHARDIRELAGAGTVTDFQRIAMDETLTRLVDAMGAAERIRSTVFPRTYRMFLHVLLYLFITFLALALAELEGVWGLAITIVIAIPFFLLEKTATHMQDPFANRPTDTACTTIAQTVEMNIRQLLGEEDVPRPPPPESFYVM